MRLDEKLQQMDRDISVNPQYVQRVSRARRMGNYRIYAIHFIQVSRGVFCTY